MGLKVLFDRLQCFFAFFFWDKESGDLILARESIWGKTDVLIPMIQKSSPLKRNQKLICRAGSTRF